MRKPWNSHSSFPSAAVAYAIIVFSAIHLSSSLPSERRDVSRTKLRFNYQKGKKYFSSASQPIRCQLMLNGNELELNLVENELLTNDPPVFLAENDGSIAKVDLKESGTQKPKYYQDTDGKAAVAVWIIVSARGSSPSHMDGIIFHENETYRISPRKNSTVNTSEDSEFDHELRKFSLHKGTTDFVMRNPTKRVIDSKIAQSSSSESRGRRAASAAYEVELFFVLDYSTYQKFTAELSYNGTSVSTSAVLQQMRYYYAQVSNLVDLRYRSITTASFTIRTKLTALYIVTRPSDSNWTETISAAGGRNGWKAASASLALSSFTEWIYGAAGAALRSSLPSFDHAVLFTSYDLYSDSGAGPSYDLIGLAYLGEICTAQSTSIIENTGALTEASTTAHELGHSLGAEHDGDGNACRASDQYIMTAVSRVATSATFQNYFLFSSCSIAYFTNVTSALSTNCLTNTGDYFNTTEWQTYVGRAPGQVYSPNSLCRQAYGNSFEACGGVDFGSTMCLSLYCYNASMSVSSSVSCITLGAGGRGLDGMSCGNNRWCQKGTCVYNASAPSAPDDCPIGDYARTSQVYSDTPYVCSNMPSSYCYDQGVYNSCCATCNKIKNNTRPGCEYGDKINCSSVTRESCPLNLNNCCRTCDAFISWPVITTTTATAGAGSTVGAGSTLGAGSTVGQTTMKSSSEAQMSSSKAICILSALWMFFCH